VAESIDKRPDEFLTDSDASTKSFRAKILKNQLTFDPDDYEIDDRFQPSRSTDPLAAHTTIEMVKALEANEHVGIDAEILGIKDGRLEKRRITEKKEFLKTFKDSDKKLREADSFSLDDTFDGGVTGLVGQDFIPLLGGPFHKQLYIYDYLRMQALAFHAYHHDPIARRAVHIIRDFTLGRGFQVVCESEENQAAWDAFAKVNNIYQMFEWGSVELSLYGEIMLWWLPNNETKIVYNLMPGQEPGRGFLPRVRLLDPSMVWEIVTYPEDITRVLYYQILSPTQYQIYTGQADGQSVPSMKFIYKQVPDNEIMHFKVNSVSNEKRGRSDLYPVFGWLKRLRDSVNYSIVGLQKAAAWSIDTTIEGSQTDLDDYAQSQSDLGTIAPAGSEFIHTSKVKREYLSNTAASRGGNTAAFDWCLSMIASGLGIPVSYFGTHLSGGQTRASAIVATEPVAKLFEIRQEKFKYIIRCMAERLWKELGLEACDVDVIFPEVITQDRSAKLKDLATAESMQWISKQTAAEIAAKELELDDFNFEREQAKTAPEDVGSMSPLTLPGQNVRPDKNSSLTSDDRAQVKSNDGY
jgi:hypothetical protein